LHPYPPDRWRTVFLGDLVDGGPFGVGALRYARDRLNSELILGNHELLLLATLNRWPERGGDFVAWAGAGGQLHDLEELARDPTLQEWLGGRPALLPLPDGTLAQHADSDLLDRLAPTAPDAVDAINSEFGRMVREGELRPLIDMLTPQRIFERQPHRLDRWLQRTGARRVVHGHTPHGRREPYVYAGGRAISFDGGLGRWGGRGNRGRGPASASVAPLPP
jgi:hypothetical protein